MLRGIKEPGRSMRIFILGILSLISFESYSRQLEFLSEEIELKVADTLCTVNGTYWFRNASSSPIEQTLFYPIVINERLPFPDTILVVDRRSNRPVNFARSEQGIFFSVTIPASFTALYNVSYTQRTPARSMYYILCTTSHWGKSLERALYRVYLPLECILTFSSIIFPQMFKENNQQVFERCEENFMPSTDFAIQWESIKP